MFIMQDLSKIKYFFFDVDNTLVQPENDKDGIISTAENMKLRPGIIKVLETLVGVDGIVYGISNQQGISEGEVEGYEIEDKMDKLIRMIFPIKIMLVYSSGNYNDFNPKPDPEMYNQFKEVIPDLTPLNSVYIGDAGFNEEDHASMELDSTISKDFSNSDRIFAQNANIPFIHIEWLLDFMEKSNWQKSAQVGCRAFTG